MTQPEFTDHPARVVDPLFSIVRQDLGQAQKLLAGAVENLMDGFLKISALSRSQQNLNTDGALLVGAAAARSVLMVDEIERTANAMVLNLQFQDMVSQLLVHAQRQIDMLEGMMAGLEVPGNLSMEDALQQVADIALRKPVAVDGMRGGEMELF